MLCSLLSGELAEWGLVGPAGMTPLTEDVGVEDGEAKPPVALGLTTDDEEGDTEGEALLCGDLAGEEVESRSGLSPLLLIEGASAAAAAAAAAACC